jgi:hypothetical protein
VNHERRIAQSLVAAGFVIFLAMGSLGWLRLAGLALVALAFYVWKHRQDGLIVGSVLAALAVYRLLGGFGTLLISLAVSGFVVAKLEPNTRRLARSVALASTGAVLLLAIEALGLLTAAWFAVVLIAVGGYMLYVEQQSGQWVTLDTLADIAKDKVYGSHIDSNVQAPTTSAPASSTPASQPTPASDTTPASHEKPATNIDATNVPDASITSEDVAAAEAVNADAASEAPDTPTEIPTKTPTETLAAETSASEPPAEPSAIPAANGYAALLEQLFAWRDQAAETYDRAPGQVLRDDILEEIANVKPQTLDALGEIRGIGSKKLERYGADILKVLREHDNA